MPTAYVIFPDGARVRVEVADTDRARARGLMFREALRSDEGMLFVFDVPGRYGFWMKNVRIPLDVIWVDARGRIVSIAPNAPPCAGDPCPTYVPGTDASFVVEVSGGFAARHGLEVGDTLAINLREPASSFRTTTRGRC